MEQPEQTGGFLDNYKPVFLELNAVDEESDDLEAKLKALKQRRSELEEKLVLAMDDAGVPRLTIMGTTFFRRNDQYPKVKDQEGLFQFLQAEGRSDLIKPNVNAQSLRSFMLERSRENLEVPECVEMFTTPRVGTRK